MRKFNLAVCCLVVVAAAMIGAAAQAELVTNGDFESTPLGTGWTRAGTTYVETGYGSPPEYNNLAITNGWSGGSFTQQIGTVVAGQTYNVSYDLGGGAGGVAGLYYNDGSSWLPLVSNSATTSGTWGTYRLGLDAMAGQSYVGQPIAVRFAAASGWTCADNFSANALSTNTGLVTNGRFTTGAAGWTSVGSGIAPEDTWVDMANKNDGSSIAQAFGTVSAGLTYHVSYDAKIPAGASLEAGLFYNDGTNWVALAAPTTVTANGGTWQTYSLSVDALAGQPYVGAPIELKFAPNGGYSWFSLDNAVVTTSSIPEPGTLSLLAAGLIGLLCYAWRKR